MHPEGLSLQEICPDPDNARITALAAPTRRLRGRIFKDIAELRLAENLPRAVAENTAEAGILLAETVLIRCSQMNAFQHTDSNQPSSPPFVVWSYIFLVSIALLALSTATLGQNIQASELPTGTIVGTVTDVNHDPIPGASVVLESPGISERPRVVTDDNGYFEFHNVKPGVPSRVSVSAGGFADWQSPVLMIEPGQFELLADIQLRIATQFTTVAVTYDPVEAATEQVKNEEQQRIFGFIPNYYVVYDPNPAALTAKLKFQLAFKVVVNPVTFTGVALLSGAQQAGDTPNYGQGAQGFGKRFGANAADGFTDIMIGGAILPSLLHQDPRYFYQGTGTTASRIRHAVSQPFVCRSDNGTWQPNYSTLGGDLASAAISNAYYPKSNRGAGLVFTNFAINTAERAAASLAQEFLLRRFTRKPGNPG